MDLYQSLVTVNPVTLIAQICNLFIQLLIVKIFFLDKIKAILDQRRDAADKEITDAQAAKAEALVIKETYEKNMLPVTDDILERAVNISVGVVDKGLGAGTGININSTEEEINQVAKNIREIVLSL